MISTRSSLVTIGILLCYFTINTEQQWKWTKPYVWNGPTKYLHSTVYKSSPLPYFPTNEKPFKPGHCELRKVVFTQDAESPQYIVYKTKIPDLKEFTLCHWHNVFNYTHDQPIFSYSLNGKSRAIYSWIENSPQKTYYSLAINGHTIYRINYPEKLFKWYHVCQSWNGHTGEWQLWINAERVGRGFYNLMVGKVIKGGGVAISGREYLDQALAVHFPAYSGELTLVTLYKAALTAGKAYNNHKHHHVHNFHHGYDESVDEADTDEPPEASTPAAPEPTRPPHLAHGGPFENGQLAPKLPLTPAKSSKDHQRPSSPTHHEDVHHHQHQLFDGGLYDFYAPYEHGGVSSEAVGGVSSAAVDETFRVNLLDRSGDERRYKRSTTASDWYKRSATAAGRSRRWTPLTFARRNARSDTADERKSEPAEWEVMKVASVCGACENDPFGTASVLSWRDTRKQFFNGALYMPALPKCYLF